MQTDRRAALRSPLHLLFNQYIDGQPYLCEAVEVSMTGLLARRIGGPEAARACYAVELAEPAEDGLRRVWLCATPVWRMGNYEALAFVGHSSFDRVRLADLLASARRALPS